MPSHRRNLLGAAGQGTAAPSPSTIVGVRSFDDAQFYAVSDWSEMFRFTGLSCGNAELLPQSGFQISPDGTWFLAGGALGTGAYSMADGSELFFLSNTAGCSAAMSKDGAYIALASGNGANTIIVETSGWTTDVTFDPALASVECYAFSWDGTKLAVGDKNGDFRIFNTSDGTAYSNALAFGNDINTIAFSRDDSLVAVGRDSRANEEVYVTAVQATMTEGDVLAYESGRNTAFLEFTPDDSLLVVINRVTGVNAGYTIETSGWTVDSSTLTGSLFPNAGALSNDGTLVIVGATTTPFTEVFATVDMVAEASEPTALASANDATWNNPDTSTQGYVYWKITINGFQGVGTNCTILEIELLTTDAGAYAVTAADPANELLDLIPIAGDFVETKDTDGLMVNPGSNTVVAGDAAIWGLPTAPDIQYIRIATADTSADITGVNDLTVSKSKDGLTWVDSASIDCGAATDSEFQANNYTAIVF